MKTHGWVEHLLMYRPWAGVMALVREIKSYYFWQEHAKPS